MQVEIVVCQETQRRIGTRNEEVGELLVCRVSIVTGFGHGNSRICSTYLFVVECGCRVGEQEGTGAEQLYGQQLTR